LWISGPPPPVTLGGRGDGPLTHNSYTTWWDTTGVDPNTLPSFVNKIGNLVLISKSRNSSASNDEFSEKKKKYLKPRVTDYPRSVQVLGYSDWTPEIIQKRTDEVGNIFLDEF
jgi:hypothetical protein